MSVHQFSSWRLLQSASMRNPIISRPLIRPAPRSSLVVPNTPPHRSFLNWLRAKSEGQERKATQDPLYAEYLTKKPPPPPPPSSGDLASSSIFEDEEGAAERKARKAGKQGYPPRDPANVRAVLDPQPEVRQRWERKMAIREVQKRGRLTRSQMIKRMERESLSKSHFLKTSVKKLGPLARQITGKTIDEAVVQMRFSKKKMAKEVQKHLEHARDEAIVRRGMALGSTTGVVDSPTTIETKQGRKRTVTDRTELYIDQAWVGRGKYGRALDHRARGQINIMRTPVTSISVVLKEEATRIREHDERKQKERKRKLWVQLPNRPITANRQHYSW